MFSIRPFKNKRIVSVKFGFYKKFILRKILLKKTISQKESKDLIFSWGYSSNIKKYNKVIFVEDGFLRSVGLGTQLIKPLSWVFDRKGIYYNPLHESDLEDILLRISMKDHMVKRIKNIRKILISEKITKYNLTPNKTSFSFCENNLLVIGQVDQDLSLKYGAQYVQNNMQFIKQVRKDFPDKQIIYKPHPDYESGLRSSSSQKKDLLVYADVILENITITDAFELSNTVVVNTSLSGFEALIRNKKVICYGEPFYAGWGLTKDMYCHSIKNRRNKKLTLEELMYGCLITYPYYFHPSSYEQIEIEEALSIINNNKNQNFFLRHLITNYFLRAIIFFRNLLKKS